MSLIKEKFKKDMANLENKQKEKEKADKEIVNKEME